MTFYCTVNIILINFVALFFFSFLFLEKDHIALDFSCVTIFVVFWIFFLYFTYFVDSQIIFLNWLSS